MSNMMYSVDSWAKGDDRGLFSDAYVYDSCIVRCIVGPQQSSPELFLSQRSLSYDGEELTNLMQICIK